MTNRAAAPLVVLRPREYQGALRNPLKGFRPGLGTPHEYGTLAKHYIRWNEIEERESDGVARITDFCGEKWRGLPERNLKVIPRVYLEWPNQGTYWPSDLTTGDYSSPAFQRRVVRLIEKLGRAWDDDPRVAFVEMGLIGKWGEQHSPEPTPEVETLLGDTFARVFRNKLVMIRYPKHFQNYRFGVYWDSFGHPGETPAMTALLESPRLADRWKSAPMGGEMAFDWGTTLGKNPTDAVVNEADAIESLVRRFHWNHVGWVSDYDAKNPDAARNAARLQKALGWRFVLDEARVPARVEPGKPFTAAFTVRNTGSSPFYYRWPVALSLHDASTRKVLWTGMFRTADVRRWLPGGGPAAEAPKPATVRGTFTLPRDFPRGNYVLALALLDPAGNLPAARFAVTNYWRGGRHPLGHVGVGENLRRHEPLAFDDPATDDSLRYKV